jgi:hypothetical protein
VRTARPDDPGAGSGDARRVWRSALLLCAAMVAGLTLGVLVPGAEAASALALPALAVQTVVSVGSLPPLAPGPAVSGGLVLLGIHLLVATVPLAVLGLAVGAGDPIGFGLIVVAVAPPAALIPTYALVLEVDSGPLLVFCLVGYALSLVATPLALLAVAGQTVGLGPIATTLGAGLIGPSILSRLGRRWILKTGERLRRGIVYVAVFVITLGLGGGLLGGQGRGWPGWPALALATAAMLARTFGGGALAGLLAPRRLRAAAPLAGAFKNIALAAAVSGTLLGPAASLPALLSFPAELACFMVMAGRRSRREAAGA